MVSSNAERVLTMSEIISLPEMREKGYWCGCRLGEVTSKWLDDIREQVMNWLKEDEDVAILVGENNVVKWMSYVTATKVAVGRGRYLVTKWRVWEDCLYSGEASTKVKVWDNVLCYYSDVTGKYERI